MSDCVWSIVSSSGYHVLGRDIGKLEIFQRRTVRMGKVLEIVVCEDQLKEQGSLSLEKS